MASSPRITCIIARRAPIALVIWRASGWSHLARWYLDTDQIEHGGWAHKRIVTYKSDLSDDGSLCSIRIDGVFYKEPNPTIAPTSPLRHFESFSVLSRTPWLHPLWSQAECGAWGGGYCFDNGDTSCTFDSGLTVHADAQPITLRDLDNEYHLRDLRRGWARVDAPPKSPHAWSEQRWPLQKTSPVHGFALQSLCERPSNAWQTTSTRRHYALVTPDGRFTELAHAAWADWQNNGHLLLSTRDGKLQRYEVSSFAPRLLTSHDLAGLIPNPQPAPAWAHPKAPDTSFKSLLA